MDADERLDALEARVNKLREAVLSMNQSLVTAINYGVTADEVTRALAETHPDPAAVLKAYKRKAGEVDAAVTYEVTNDAKVLESLERQRMVIRWMEKIIEDRQASAG